MPFSCPTCSHELSSRCFGEARDYREENEIHEVSHAISRQVEFLFGVRSAAILLIDHTPAQLFKFDRSLLAEGVILSRHPLESSVPHVVRPDCFGGSAVLAIPLCSYGELVGALMLSEKTSGEPFTDRELTLIARQARLIALSVQNLAHRRNLEVLNQELDRRVQESTAQLQEALDELKRTQAMLVQTESLSALSRVVSGVAHEINNPLAVIYMGLMPLESKIRRLQKALQAACSELPPRIAQLIDTTYEVPETVDGLDQGLTSIRESSLRVRDIVDSLRTFSRVDSLDHLTPVAVASGITSTLALVRGQFREITFHTELAEVPEVMGSSGRLNQVFMNLLVNACQAITGSGNVWVRLYQDPSGPRIIVEIEDDGCGIAVEDHVNIFEPFYTTKPDGTGLGLSICYGIVQKHGGTLHMRSRKGIGTTFRIELPALIAQRTPCAPY